MQICNTMERVQVASFRKHSCVRGVSTWGVIIYIICFIFTMALKEDILKSHFTDVEIKSQGSSRSQPETS